MRLFTVRINLLISSSVFCPQKRSFVGELFGDCGTGSAVSLDRERIGCESRYREDWVGCESRYREDLVGCESRYREEGNEISRIEQAPTIEPIDFRVMEYFL